MLYIKDYEPPIDPPEEKDVIDTCYYCHCETDELTKYKGVYHGIVRYPLQIFI